MTKTFFGGLLGIVMAAVGSPTDADIDHVLPCRTVRFPGANYSALAVRDGLAVTSSHWSREDCGAVFDVSCPTNVRFLMRYPAKGYSCASPVFFGERCYVPEMFSAVVLNVKDRQRPKVEARLNPQFPRNGCNHFWVSDGQLYFEAFDGCYRIKEDGLTFEKADVKPPKRQSVKAVTTETGIEVALREGALVVDGQETPYAYDLSSIAVMDGLAWVYAPEHGGLRAALLPLEVVRGGLAKFSSRVCAKPVDRGEAYQTMGMQTASCVTRVGRLVFADDGIYQVVRRGQLTCLRERTAAASNMSVDGLRVAIAQCSRCRVMDFSDLANVTCADFVPPAEKPLHLTGCALEGDLLYVAYTLKEAPKMDFIYSQPERGFVAAYDVKDPSRPLATLEIPACVAMVKVGDFLYVTCRTGELVIVEAPRSGVLRLAEVRKDLQDGPAYKIKRFASSVYLMTGHRVLELDTKNARHPQVLRLFERGAGTAAPSYDDFTVEGASLYALAHASVDVFPLKGVRLDRVANDCGTNGVRMASLEAADPAIFADHVAWPRPPSSLTFQAGRYGNCFGAHVMDWVRLDDGSYAVAYGEAGVVLCDGEGRFVRDMPRTADAPGPLFAVAVIAKGGEVFARDADGKAYRVFSGLFDGKRDMKGVWHSLGTSITWYNNHVENAGGRFTRGYQDRVRDRLLFSGFSNAGISGGRVGDQYLPAGKADYYTIEHGINDWGKSTPVGTFDDYLTGATNGTFYANYRRLIDKIRVRNPAAKVILCTPRKGYGFGTYLPKQCDGEKNGLRLCDYAEAVRRIAAYERLPVADFYATCGEQDELAELSIDVALHPNDAGYQRMADELLRVFVNP